MQTPNLNGQSVAVQAEKHLPRSLTFFQAFGFEFDRSSPTNKVPAW